ncbi:MAG: hypothetical protein U0795_26315 [Pirellulales bacterium]
MKNEKMILGYREIFGPENGTAEETLNSILSSLGAAKRTAEMAADCISSIGPVTDAVIPALIKNLHQDERASRAIRSALRGMGDLALEQLVASLPNATAPLRYYLIRAIGEFGAAARSASRSVQLLLGSTDPVDRLYAAAALTSMSEGRSDLTIEIAKAFSGLGYSELEVEFATICLADLASDSADALPIIILGLIRLDDFLASGPMYVLGKIGFRGIPAVPALLHRVCQRSTSEFDRCNEYAASALEAIAVDLRTRGELTEPLERALACRVPGSKMQANCRVVAETTNAIEQLEAWLDHSDLMMRLGAIAGLGFFGPAAMSMAKKLDKFLSADSPEERLHAAIACRQICGHASSYGRIAAMAVNQTRLSPAMMEWVQQVLSDKGS